MYIVVYLQKKMPIKETLYIISHKYLPCLQKKNTLCTRTHKNIVSFSPSWWLWPSLSSLLLSSASWYPLFAVSVYESTCIPHTNEIMWFLSFSALFYAIILWCAAHYSAFLLLFKTCNDSRNGNGNKLQTAFVQIFSYTFLINSTFFLQSFQNKHSLFYL